jgi:ferric-dicitrate binding protein FerR (iron transport regulator)
MHQVRNNIDRYLSEDLPPGSDMRLRSHLRDCEGCRSHYDQQVVLLRALAGNPDTPTIQEEDRMVHLALQAAGLAEPRREKPEKQNLVDRLVWARIPLLAAAVLGLVFMAVSALHLLSVTTEGPVVAASLTKARDLTLNGVPVDFEASPKVLVREGARLEVGKRGIAELSLKRGGIVRVFPDSALSLTGPGSGLDLGRGKIWCMVEPSTAPFTVFTDIAEIRVVGTSFVVDRRRSGETEVRVLEGKVEVKNIKRKEKVLVGSGSKTRVAQGEPPKPPRRYSPGRDRSDWDRTVDELWRDIKRAFRKVKKYFENNM